MEEPSDSVSSLGAESELILEDEPLSCSPEKKVDLLKPDVVASESADFMDFSPNSKNIPIIDEIPKVESTISDELKVANVINTEDTISKTEKLMDLSAVESAGILQNNEDTSDALMEVDEPNQSYRENAVDTPEPSSQEQISVSLPDGDLLTYVETESCNVDKEIPSPEDSQKAANLPVESTNVHRDVIVESKGGLVVQENKTSSDTYDPAGACELNSTCPANKVNEDEILQTANKSQLSHDMKLSDSPPVAGKSNKPDTVVDNALEDCVAETYNDTQNDSPQITGTDTVVDNAVKGVAEKLKLNNDPEINTSTVTGQSNELPVTIDDSAMQIVEEKLPLNPGSEIQDSTVTEQPNNVPVTAVNNALKIVADLQESTESIETTKKTTEEKTSDIPPTVPNGEVTPNLKTADTSTEPEVIPIDDDSQSAMKSTRTISVENVGTTSMDSDLQNIQETTASSIPKCTLQEINVQQCMQCYLVRYTIY